MCLKTRFRKDGHRMNNDKIIETLEFNKIRQAVNQFTQTELAKIKVSHMHPSSDMTTIDQWQNETEEALAILNQNRLIPIPRLKHLNEALKRLEVGAGLNGQEIAEVGKLLTSIDQVVAFFRTLEEDNKNYPALLVWIDKCISLPEISRLITQAVSDEGTVLTTASSELARIRRDQQNTEQQIRSQLNQIVKSKANQLTESLITIRNGRYVVPVKAEFRHQIPGTIHDQSSTGQTLYVEPQSVASLNNKISELKVAEQREIERILLEISQELMPYTQEIRQNQEMISELDFIQARAGYAKSTNASRPSLSENKHVALWQARHPLIKEEDIVANDIIIGENYKSLIITGPNTGGKTILLKTLGLLHLMGQSGLHIPCEQGSQIGIFDQVYADIGDEQSIEQSLSTFSGHMTNIVRIIGSSTPDSLVLFDELGSGTDPQEGASLAMAILDYYRDLGATVMATTHYPELKLYANNAPDTINASMEFNAETLSPTYRLMIGVPGRSNALEISKRLGLADHILDKAREGISQHDLSINEMIANLEREKREAEQAYLKADQFLKQSQMLHDDLSTEYQRFMEQKDNLIAKAKEKANEMVQEKESQADKLISEIRELQLEQGQNTTIKEDVLIGKKSSFSGLKEPLSLKKNKVLKKAKKEKTLKVGDDVEVLSYGQRGTLIEKADDNHFIVQMGILKMKIPNKELQAIEKVESKRKVNVQRQAGSKVQTSVDLRGQRYDAAMSSLNQYLDKALLSNHPMVTIIHGKGTGAIREGVQKALRRHPQVDRFEFSPPNAGGDGSTVVYFK